MWRKWLFLAVLSFFSLSARAAVVSIYATGDNYIYYWTGSSWQSVTNSSWKNAYHLSLTQDIGSSYSLYFAVKSPRAYAGFLADMTLSEGVFSSTGTNQLLSDASHWQITPIDYWTGTLSLDPDTLSTWQSPEAYAANNDTSSYWYQENGYSPITNISNDAQWIWLDSYSGKTAAVVKVEYTIERRGIRGPISTVPEPAPLLLLTIGLLVGRIEGLKTINEG